VFKGGLRQKFIDTVKDSLEQARPVWLIKDYYQEKSSSQPRLYAHIAGDSVRLELTFRDGGREDVTQKYWHENPKFQAKLEKALDEIEIMLHELNKTVNQQISTIRQGHSEAEKSLDEMFFD